MRVKIFTIISMLFLGLTNVQAEEKDISISNESLSNSCLTTIDINITENLALDCTSGQPCARRRPCVLEDVHNDDSKSRCCRRCR